MMKLVYHDKKNAAFTLLEIMVAIALLVMIVVAIYASWNSILKGSRVALDAAAEEQRKRITVRALHDSLLCACMFSANATNYGFISDMDTEFSSLSFVARLPRSFPRSGKFGDLAVRRLNFTVESGEDNTRNLVLRQRPLIMDFDKDEQQSPLVLARDVTKFLVEYVDPKTGDWVEFWNATNRLPTEIRFTLGLGRLDQFSTHPQENIINIVAVPSIAVRPEWEGGQSGAGVPGGGNRNPGNLNPATPNPGNFDPGNINPGGAPGLTPVPMAQQR